MKRFAILFVVALSTSTFGGFIGYYIAKRSQPPPGREMYLLHEGLDRQARVYMRFLRAQESAQPEQMADLRRQALATLRVYVQEVGDMQARGFQWAPIDQELYAFAREYVAAHPKKE
jgi:hypothetical protein